MKIYFAQFTPAEDKPGAWCVDFPDLEGCFTEGENLQEALENARECLTGYLEACIANDEDLPDPSDVACARDKAEKSCRVNGESIPEGTFYQAVLSEKVSHLLEQRQRDKQEKKSEK